jgi:hypothetical protein
MSKRLIEDWLPIAELGEKSIRVSIWLSKQRLGLMERPGWHLAIPNGRGQRLAIPGRMPGRRLAIQRVHTRG